MKNGPPRPVGAPKEAMDRFTGRQNPSPALKACDGERVDGPFGKAPMGAQEMLQGEGSIPKGGA